MGRLVEAWGREERYEGGGKSSCNTRLAHWGSGPTSPVARRVDPRALPRPMRNDQRKPVWPRRPCTPSQAVCSRRTARRAPPLLPPLSRALGVGGGAVGRAAPRSGRLSPRAARLPYRPRRGDRQSGAILANAPRRAPGHEPAQQRCFFASHTPPSPDRCRPLNFTCKGESGPHVARRPDAWAARRASMHGKRSSQSPICHRHVRWWWSPSRRVRRRRSWASHTSTAAAPRASLSSNPRLAARSASRPRRC